MHFVVLLYVYVRFLSKIQYFPLILRHFSEMIVCVSLISHDFGNRYQGVKRISVQNPLFLQAFNIGFAASDY